MSTKCYAMVRGSGIRVTGLTSHGAIPDPIQFATSKSVAVVTINEVTDSGGVESLNSDGDDTTRVRFQKPDQPLSYTADVNFLRVDPGVLSLVSGVPVVLNSNGDVAGFDSATRRHAAAFALEVWSRLAGDACDASGARQYGYTVFPFLKGGFLSGFEFRNGLASFNLRGAQTRKVPRWGVGPYDLEGPHERLTKVVSRNTLYRTTLTTAVPPDEGDGIQTTEDIIYGGTATVTTSDVIDGGSAASTSPWIIYGGQAV